MARLTILTGHYGSGKSEIAVNLALKERVDMIADLDVLNPYFRTRSVKTLLNNHGISLAESTLEGRNASDLPYVSPRAWRPIHDASMRAIYDLAGTANGARLLRQVDVWPEDVAFYFVINTARLETQTTAQIITLAKTLEDATGLSLTGIIHNTNLLEETTPEMITNAEPMVAAAAKALGLEVISTVYLHSITPDPHWLGTPLPLTRYIGDAWLKGGY